MQQKNILSSSHVITTSKKLVIKDMCHGGPRVGIRLQQAVYQILGLHTHLVRRNGEFVFFYFGIRVLEAAGLERRLANQQRVEYAAQRPDVHLVRVALLVQHLRRNIVRCAA